MPIRQELEAALGSPQALETLYRQALRDNLADEFAAEIAQRYGFAPENPLLAAWYFRLQAETPAQAATRRVPWPLAIVLSLALSLLLWLATPALTSSSPEIPALFLIWAPMTALMVLVFLTLASLGNQPARQFVKRLQQVDARNPLLLALALGALALFALWIRSTASTPIQILLLLHLPVLSTLAVALYLVGPGSDDENRYALLLKAGEILLTGGIILGAAMAFVGITVGLFSAIGITFPDPVLRYLFLGVPGLVPVLTIALTYDAALPPREQRLDQGLPKLIYSVARLFLPLALLVGVIYLASIPANFSKPFEQREVLIVYNAMLFGVMALLAFATPLHLEEISPRWQSPLRRAILLLAAMTIVVSLYALSATAYRTMLGGPTANRVTVIGWNVLNLAILLLFLFRQLRAGSGAWIPLTQWVFRLGLVGYGLWALVVVGAIPFLFR